MSRGFMAGFARIGCAFLLILGLVAVRSPLYADTFNVNSTADGLNPGTVTLRSAIQAANRTPGGNIINLTIPGTYKITLTGVDPGDNSVGAFAILPGGGDLTIMNTSGGAVIVDGNLIDRVFTINPGAATTPFSVTMNGFTITNGSAQNPANPDGPDASGGGIRVVGPVSLTLNNMTVTNNQATADGGGISMENTFSTAWKLTLNNTIVTGNRAGDFGGGIETDGSGNVFLTAGTVISKNTALNSGGGICLDSIQAGTVFQSANLKMQNTEISDNRVLAASVLGGGGIFNAGNGTVTISNGTIENNNSAGIGGGYADANGLAALSITGSAFLNNVAAGNGGGIAAAGLSVTITQSEIDGNTSGALGGGLYQNNGTATISQSTFASNTAITGGGGIELASGDASIVNSTMTGNSIGGVAPSSGGGIASTSPGAVTLQNDTISGNAASGNASGGGIFFIQSPSFTLQNTIVAGNAAPFGPDASGPIFTDNGGNLIGVSGPLSGNSGFIAATTQTGTLANPLNPVLGPLANNGGPTLTMAPLSGSPAIDKGVAANLTIAVTTDQRGVTRPQGSAFDVGAYEFNNGPTPTAKLSVLNLDFGDLGIGASASQTVTLTNTGTGDLALSAVAFSGANSGDFTVTPIAGCAAPATLAASQSCRYSVTFTPATQGPRTASLTFTDDTLNAPSSTQVVTIVGAGITLTATNTNLALTGGTSPSPTGASVTFTATVTPSTATGLVNFFDNSTSIGAVSLSGGSAALTTSSLSAGTHSITAQYLGDTFDSASASSALQEQVISPAAADFTIAANPSTATVAAGGSATFTFTITPQNGFAQTVSLSCTGLPSGATCNFAPASLTASNAAVTSTLTITTTAPTTSRLRGPGTGNGVLNAWLSTSGVLFGWLWIAAGRRRRGGASARCLLALSLALVAAVGTAAVGLTGCGGNTATAPKTVRGTPAGTNQITVVASGGQSSHTVAVTLTVQ